MHTRIVLEDGHFYLESAGGAFGTYVGLPKKKFFQVTSGDNLLFGQCRCGIEVLPAAFVFLDGIIDKVLPRTEIKGYDFRVCKTSASLEERLKASRKED